jgi:cobalt/nickel transport system permease protein
MHISDGILPGTMILATTALAAAGVANGLRKMDVDHIPRAGIVAAVFFVASLIHVPIGPSSAHLVLTGLTGLLLGWCAFPAIAAALLLQVVFFGFGGLTSWGANVLNMALPAVICHSVFHRGICGRAGSGRILWAAAAGACGISLSALMVAGTLFLCGREFIGVATAVLAANAPVMMVEGLVTGSVIAFLWRVQPEILAGCGARDELGTRNAERGTRETLE